MRVRCFGGPGSRYRNAFYITGWGTQGKGPWGHGKVAEGKRLKTKTKKPPYPCGSGGCIVMLERETRFELATSTLARLHSTTELFPLSTGDFIPPSLPRSQPQNPKKMDLAFIGPKAGSRAPPTEGLWSRGVAHPLFPFPGGGRPREGGVAGQACSLMGDARCVGAGYQSPEASGVRGRKALKS